MIKRGWVYKQWMQEEGIPLYEAGAGVEDVKELPRRPWARLGGLGTFIELAGTKEGGKMVYVVEIPAGGALEPEKHLYEEMLFILRGRGLTEVWHEPERKLSFEWGERSLFAVPLNAWHRLVNGGREPVLILGQSDAPVVMQSFRDTEFIFNCDYKFTDRFSGGADYFVASQKRYKDDLDTRPGGIRTLWETNFVPDVLKTGGAMPVFASWPVSGAGAATEAQVGTYNPAHFHKAGALISTVEGEGYTLLWHRQRGTHPFQDGHGDKVIKMPWKPGSIFCPQEQFFHQHFNILGPCRLMRTIGGTTYFGSPTLVMDDYTSYGKDPVAAQIAMVSMRQGGTLIEHEDEDPEIRRMFQEELRKKGVEFKMPPVVYRTDRPKLSW